MPITLWRIAADTPEYGADDLSGRGAGSTGGRWNREGTPCIYASQSIALACLETLVHLSGPKPLPLNRFLVRIDMPEEAWRRRTLFDVRSHVGWHALPAGLVSLNRGDNWLKADFSLVAKSLRSPWPKNAIFY